MRNRKFLFSNKKKSSGILTDISEGFFAVNNQKFPFPYGLQLKFAYLFQKMLGNNPVIPLRIFQKNLLNFSVATQFYKSLIVVLSGIGSVK